MLTRGQCTRNERRLIGRRRKLTNSYLGKRPPDRWRLVLDVLYLRLHFHENVAEVVVNGYAFCFSSVKWLLSMSVRVY